MNKNFEPSNGNWCLVNNVTVTSSGYFEHNEYSDIVRLQEIRLSFRSTSDTNVKPIQSLLLKMSRILQIVRRATDT